MSLKINTSTDEIRLKNKINERKNNFKKKGEKTCFPK
jgi:hypothetical protein